MCTYQYICRFLYVWVKICVCKYMYVHMYVKFMCMSVCMCVCIISKFYNYLLNTKECIYTHFTYVCIMALFLFFKHKMNSTRQSTLGTFKPTAKVKLASYLWILTQTHMGYKQSTLACGLLVRLQRTSIHSEIRTQEDFHLWNEMFVVTSYNTGAAHT